MSVFGRAYGANITGRLYKSGKQIQARSVREAIDHGLAYATEDRKVYGLNLIDDIKRNISGAALGKLSHPRAGSTTARNSRLRTPTAPA